MWTAVGPTPPPEEATTIPVAASSLGTKATAAVEPTHAPDVAVMVAERWPLASFVSTIASGVKVTAVSTCIPLTGQGTNAGKRKRTETAKTRKCRRGLLQDEEASSSGGEDAADPTTPGVPACIVVGDPNLMSTGDGACAGLNPEEDSNLLEESEAEEDDDDSWDGDWNIGYLTDEDSDADQEELPATVWSSFSKDGKAISAMRANG
ncbi:hypothetical protein V7S43_005904 [Phytophthora oleae]|uniref:Uncharacterized protein n=1 Tax=Phytophthora oleae TaxID=2107226 RepID=A0ABD3FQ72_9STRA